MLLPTTCLGPRCSVFVSSISFITSLQITKAIVERGRYVSGRIRSLTSTSRYSSLLPSPSGTTRVLGSCHYHRYGARSCLHLPALHLYIPLQASCEGICYWCAFILAALPSYHCSTTQTGTMSIQRAEPASAASVWTPISQVAGNFPRGTVCAASADKGR